MSSNAAISDIPIIDTDSHVTEPYDLWTSRMPARFAALAARPVWVEEAGEDQWKVGDVLIEGVGRHSVAGWHEFAPAYPKSHKDVDPAVYDAKDRLQRLDEYGMQAQVLYPNIIAFSTIEFLRLGSDFAMASIQAWNDYVSEWSEVAPDRLLPMAMIPFWDVDAAIAEMLRAKDQGHRGVIFPADLEGGGFPALWDPHWDRLYGAAQDAELSINFHVGLLMPSAEEHKKHWKKDVEDRTMGTTQWMLNAARGVAAVACKGICHRFPRLNFVSVESGIGYWPYVMESLDWHWKNYGGHQLHPERELPSFYFRRQIFGTFWFEHDSARETVQLLPDNVMFETDFPHTTSLSPGPASAAGNPREMALAAMEGVDRSIVSKVFYENAARLYHLPPLQAN